MLSSFISLSYMNVSPRLFLRHLGICSDMLKRKKCIVEKPLIKPIKCRTALAVKSLEKFSLNKPLFHAKGFF